MRVAYKEHAESESCTLGYGKSSVQMYDRWRGIWRWVARAAANDDDIAARRREHRARQIADAEDRAVSMSNVALNRVFERLRELDAEEIPAAVLDRWIRTLTDIQFKALGRDEPQRIELTGKDGGAVEIAQRKPDMSALSDEDVAALRAMFKGDADDSTRGGDTG